MEEQQKSPIGRRAVAKGIAWSVPAFALATAAPALAASPAIIITEGDVCKYAGNSGPTGTFQSYLFPVTIQNVSNEEVCITATGARVILTDGTTKGGNPVFWNAAPGSPGAAPRRDDRLHRDRFYGDLLAGDDRNRRQFQQCRDGIR